MSDKPVYVVEFEKLVKDVSMVQTFDTDALAMRIEHILSMMPEHMRENVIVSVQPKGVRVVKYKDIPRVLKTDDEFRIQFINGLRLYARFIGAAP
ncbi:MAG: hypothetical protein QW320_09815 [Ignisphaera sp.]